MTMDNRRAEVLTEAVALIEAARAADEAMYRDEPAQINRRVGMREAMAVLRRQYEPAPEPSQRPRVQRAPVRTPCGFPPCDDGPGEPCDRHEREQAHAEGDHELCGPECAGAVLHQRVEAVLEEAHLEWMRPGSDAGERPLVEHQAAALVPLFEAERDITVHLAANQLRTDADLRATEGETELAEYGRELAELIQPKTTEES